MDFEKVYKRIKGYVYNKLHKDLHDRHYEDCVQYVAMEYFRGRTNLEWSVFEYCRQNGFGKRGKVGAKTIEQSSFIGLSTDENEDKSENYYLLDQNAKNEFEEEKREVPTFEDFIRTFELKEEITQWVLRSYKLDRKNISRLNSLRKNLV